MNPFLGSFWFRLVESIYKRFGPIGCVAAFFGFFGFFWMLDYFVLPKR